MSKHKIEYGSHIFDDDTISSGTCHLVISPIANSLEVNTFSAVVVSSEDLTLDFKRNTKLVYSFNGEIFGIFYIQKIEPQTDKEYKITATSIIGILTESNHYGGVYSGILAKDLISDICGPVPFSMRTNLQDIKLYGYLPIASRRDNLVQALIAIGAVVKTDRLGVIQVTGLYDQPTGVVDDDHLSINSTPQVDGKVTDLILLEHQFLMTANEEKVIYEGNTQQNDIITFENPMYDLLASGFTILESGANYAKLSSGSGKLTGKEYRHNTREVSRHLNDAEFENTKRVENATLVSLVNSSVVADNLANYLSKSYNKINSDAQHTGYFPGDIIKTLNPRTLEEVNAFVSESELTLGSFIRAKGEWVVDYIPHESGAKQFLDKRVLMTEDGEFEVPDGVNSIRYIIISGGDGGQPGKDGAKGTNGGSGGPGTSGKSGEVGEGGSGGKILEVIDDTVVAGQKFAVKIGLGGAPGQPGTATTFGDRSSDEGEASEFGYIDPTTGERFASKGQSGLQADPTPTNTYMSNLTCYFRLNPSSTLYIRQSTVGQKNDTGVFCGSDLIRVETISTTQYNSYVSLEVTCSKADDGFSPPNADDATEYGGGGQGGHGGGGGQGGNGYTISSSPNPSSFLISGSTYNVKYDSRSLGSGEGGDGGKGSQGGSGKNGCVIIFYSEPKEVEKGYLRDSDQKILLDSTGKLLVVG